MADRSQSDPFGLPGFDLGEMVQRLQPPGVDLGAVMERGAKDIEALRQANQAMVDGFTALARKQGEIFQRTLEAWRDAAAEGRLASPQEGFEAALGNMRELAEIAAQSQSQAAEIIRERMEANLAGLFKPSGGGAQGGGAQGGRGGEAGD